MGLGENGAIIAIYVAASVFGFLALLVTQLSVTEAYVLAVAVSLCLVVVLWRLEKLPYERQEAYVMVDGPASQSVD
jgi:hypothetical protein